ncbi:MAG: c-type cytochrome biogenesis protein CcsB [Desulfobacteraceae bacterium]|nr:c-type cytochrome biogenesis protein CcsB [Desulfobacteraceae bacterium]
MSNSLIFSIVTFIYCFAGILYLASWIFKKQLPAKAATWVAWAGLIGNGAGLLLRWFESYEKGSAYGHAPLTNLYESLTFFAFIISSIYLFVEWKYKSRILGALAMPLAFLVMAYASISPGKQIQPLIPALKSNWLIAHVFTCFIGYAAFAIAFAVSIVYLFKSKEKEGKDATVPDQSGALSTGLLDELTHQLIMFGFLFLTSGIITGAVWAYSAWGRYWGWDPKETWSLITWCIYAALLHLRMMRGWRGKRIAVMSIIGFVAVLFTYFGVNLLPGLHSYQ